MSTVIYGYIAPIEPFVEFNDAILWCERTAQGPMCVLSWAPDTHYKGTLYAYLFTPTPVGHNGHNTIQRIPTYQPLIVGRKPKYHITGIVRPPAPLPILPRKKYESVHKCRRKPRPLTPEQAKEHREQGKDRQREAIQNYKDSVRDTRAIKGLLNPRYAFPIIEDIPTIPETPADEDTYTVSVDYYD